MYNLGILLIFDTHFSGKNFVPPPLKLTELLRLWWDRRVLGPNSVVSGNPDKREGDWGQLQGVVDVGDGGQRARAPSPQIHEKYVSGNYYVKFGHFVNFSGKYN